jgi:hypothetical protein
MFWDFDLERAGGRLEVLTDVSNELARWRNELSEHCDSNDWAFVRLAAGTTVECA